MIDCIREDIPYMVSGCFDSNLEISSGYVALWTATSLEADEIFVAEDSGQRKILDYSYRYFQTYVLFNCILIDMLDLYKYNIKYEEECLWSKRKKERIILLNGFVVY